MGYRFGISIALNLFLLTTIVAARVDASRDSAPSASSPNQGVRFGDPSVGGEPLADIGDLESRLIAAGFRHSDIKPMILGWLDSSQSGSAIPGLAGPEAIPFWRSDYRPGLSSARRQIAKQGVIRDSLLGHFGNNAAIDPAFASVFRPLGPDYAFLSSEAQIELQAHQLGLLESARSPAAPAPGEVQCAAPPDRALQATASVPAGFDAVAEREYRLRFSPLAQQLRASDSSRDEREFRALFDLLVRLERSASPLDQAEIRRELRTAIGDPAFDRFWAARDPAFAALQTYLRSHDHAEQLILAAYAIVNQAQERLLMAIANQRGPESVLRDVARIRTEEAASLARLLGDEVASGLTAAMTRAAMSLSSTMANRC